MRRGRRVGKRALQEMHVPAKCPVLHPQSRQCLRHPRESGLECRRPPLCREPWADFGIVSGVIARPIGIVGPTWRRRRGGGRKHTASIVVAPTDS